MVVLLSGRSHDRDQLALADVEAGARRTCRALR